MTIEARGITKVFDGIQAVQNLSFDVESQHIFALIGPSGCGKTTTIRLLTGLYRPTGGQVKVFGHDPTRFSRSDREKIGYLPQSFVLYPELSVTENLSFVGGLFGVVRRRRRRIREVLDFVDLWEHRDKRAAELSGGMRRRLGLAAALLHEPTLLFVDEPTAGIDPVLRARFWDGFRELRDRGCTIVLTTQYVTEAEYCDQVAVMKEGKLIAAGTPNEIRREAVGGEAIELEATGLTPELLLLFEAMPGTQRITSLSPEIVHLIVDDADEAMQMIDESLDRNGIVPIRLERRQANFDEVFVLLMEQAETDSEAQTSSANGPRSVATGGPRAR